MWVDQGPWSLASSAPLPVAYLTVALPHDGLTPFEASLLTPFQGEDASDVVVRSRAMNAQNVTQQVADIDRRLAQLTDYRERLGVLAKRNNASDTDARIGTPRSRARIRPCA